MDIIIRGIDRSDIVEIIDEIRQANRPRNSILNCLKDRLINDVAREDAKVDRKRALDAGFSRHYTVDLAEDADELMARVKYVSQSIKVVDESLTEMIEVMRRLHDNVCSSSESTQA